jgi:hypothetical protein
LVFVTVYVIEWYTSACEPLGGTDFSFAPGEGRVRYATIGPPGKVHPPGYPHAARTVERLEVAVPAGWELDDTARPSWLINRRDGTAERLEAADVYIRAVRGSAGFSVTDPVVHAE